MCKRSSSCSEGGSYVRLHPEHVQGITQGPSLRWALMQLSRRLRLLSRKWCRMRWIRQASKHGRYATT